MIKRVFLIFVLIGCTSCRTDPPAPHDSSQDRTPGVDSLPIWHVDLDRRSCTEANAVTPASYEQPLQVTRELRWKCLLGQGQGSVSSPVVLTDGTIVVLSMWGGLQGISPSGKVIWTLSSPSGSAARDGLVGQYPLAITGDGLIVFGDAVAGDPKNGAYAKMHGTNVKGALLWTWIPEGVFPHFMPAIAGPFLGKDGTVVVATTDQSIYVVSPTTGKTQRKTTLPGSGHQMIIDSTGRSFIAVYGDESKLVAITPEGKVLWARVVVPRSQNATSLDINTVAALALTSRGDLIVTIALDPTAKGTDATTEVASIDPACGATRWSVRTKGAARSQLLVGRKEEIFFATTQHGKGYDALVGLSPHGEHLFRRDLPRSLNTPEGGSAYYAHVGPIGADGAIYALVNDNTEARIIVYSQTGEPLWELPLKDTKLQNGPALLKDGTLLVGAFVKEGTTPLTTASYLFAIQTTSPGLANSSWPRARHDNRSTSNVATPIL